MSRQQVEFPWDLVQKKKSDLKTFLFYESKTQLLEKIQKRYLEGKLKIISITQRQQLGLYLSSLFFQTYSYYICMLVVFLCCFFFAEFQTHLHAETIVLSGNMIFSCYSVSCICFIIIKHSSTSVLKSFPIFHCLTFKLFAFFQYYKHHCSKFPRN